MSLIVVCVIILLEIAKQLLEVMDKKLKELVALNDQVSTN